MSFSFYLLAVGFINAKVSATSTFLPGDHLESHEQYCKIFLVYKTEKKKKKSKVEKLVSEIIKRKEKKKRTAVAAL